MTRVQLRRLRRVPYRNVVLALVLGVVAAACGGDERSVLRSGERQPTGITVTSPAFASKRAVPERYSCEGENLPPPLRWQGTPPGTAELAVVVEDPDAPKGTFVHWIVVGIDPATTAIEPETLPPGARVLPGSSDNATYVGPCPPEGSGAHHYFFEVYALSRRPDLADGAPPLDKVRAIRGAASAGGWLVGTFKT